MKRNQRGFTLIELLVVIAIIGILVSVILVSLSGAQAKSRDSARLINIKNLQLTVERYYDANNTYPSTGNQWWGACSVFGSHDTTGSNGYIPNLAPTYIQVLPIDPQQTTSHCYLYRSNGTDYFLMAYQTVEGVVPAEFKRPSAPSEQDYAVYTAGASTW